MLCTHAHTHSLFVLLIPSALSLPNHAVSLMHTRTRSLISHQMTRVISSPSMSTTGLDTWIRFRIADEPAAAVEESVCIAIPSQASRQPAGGWTKNKEKSKAKQGSGRDV